MKRSHKRLTPGAQIINADGSKYPMIHRNSPADKNELRINDMSLWIITRNLDSDESVMLDEKIHYRSVEFLRYLDGRDMTAVLKNDKP